jgi:hypothetical protein
VAICQSRRTINFACGKKSLALPDLASICWSIDILVWTPDFNPINAFEFLIKWICAFLTVLMNYGRFSDRAACATEFDNLYSHGSFSFEVPLAVFKFKTKVFRYGEI